MTMKAVGTAAMEMVQEVEIQFDEVGVKNAFFLFPLFFLCFSSLFRELPGMRGDDPRLSIT